MKFVLFILLIAGQTNSRDVTPSIATQEFDSREACEAAAARMMTEAEKGGFSLGTSGSRAWCVKKG